MSHKLRVLVLAAGCLGAVPMPAAAAGNGLLELLSELHGPGPFWGLSARYRFLCVSRAEDVIEVPGTSPEAQVNPEQVFRTWLGPHEPGAELFRPVPPNDLAKALEEEDPRERAAKLCEYDRRVRGYAIFNFKFFQSFQNNLFPGHDRDDAYRVRIVDLSVSYYARLHNAFDLGTRAGFGRFSGKAFTPFYRLSADVADARFYPLAVAGDGVLHRAIAMSLAAQLYLPGFDGADFCNPELDERGCTTRRAYQAAPHLQWRIGIHASVPALITLIRN